MIFESTVLVRRWMEHPTHGVVQKLATVPRDKVVGQVITGQWPVPTTPAIYADVERPELAAQDLNYIAKSPALVVYVDERVEDTGSNTGKVPYQPQRSFRATIVYITQGEAADVAIREGGFTLRAVKKCLNDFNSQSLSAGFRDYNKVKLVKIGPITTNIVSGAVGKSDLWGFLVATLHVIDEDP